MDNFKIQENRGLVRILHGYYSLVSLFADPTSAEEGLNLSIEKWDFMLHYYENQKSYEMFKRLYDGRNKTCGLCRFHKNDCQKCMIFGKTGKTNCRATPYENYCTCYIEVRRPREDIFNYAKQELAFLKTFKEEIKK